MNPVRTRALPLAASLILLAAAPTRAGEPADEPDLPPAVQRFLQNIYNPQKVGLKDLSVVLDTPLLRGSGIFKHIKVMIYFQTPDRHQLDIVGLGDDATRDFYLEQLKPLAVITRYLFGLGGIMEKILHASEIEVSRQDGLDRIEAHPATEKIRKEFKKIVLWLDEASRPVRLEQDSPGLGKISVAFTTIRKEGKILISTLEATGVKGIEGTVRQKIEYEEKEKVWLPASVALSFVKKDENGEEKAGTPQIFRFKDYKINEGLAEGIFEDPDAEEEEDDDDGEEEAY